MTEEDLPADWIGGIDWFGVGRSIEDIAMRIQQDGSVEAGGNLDFIPCTIESSGGSGYRSTALGVTRCFRGKKCERGRDGEAKTKRY